MINLLIALLYLGLMVYLANIEQVNGETHPFYRLMQYSLVGLVGIWVLNALLFAFISPNQVADPDFAKQLESVNQLTAFGFVIFGLMCTILLIVLIRSDKWHRRLENLTTSRFINSQYNANSSVHRLAFMLMIVQIVAVAWTFVVSGGLDGLDFNYESSWQAIGDLVVSATLYTVLAFLGVGWMFRRNTVDTLHRLGIRLPVLQDVLAGIGMAVLLYVLLLIASTIWMLTVSPEIMEQQTAASQRLFQAFNSSLLMGLILAVLTGISEEILFRGAIQPIFGLIPTALFFTIIHIQYALTPATIILFGVSLGFGWLRQRVSTTAAMIAHMTYNFIPFLLFTLTANTGAL